MRPKVKSLTPFLTARDTWLPSLSTSRSTPVAAPRSFHSSLLGSGPPSSPYGDPMAADAGRGDGASAPWPPLTLRELFRGGMIPVPETAETCRAC